MISYEHAPEHVSSVARRPLCRNLVAGVLACRVFDHVTLAQTADKHEATKQAADRPDLSKEPTLYLVGYAHLDTEWRWEYPHVILPS